MELSENLRILRLAARVHGIIYARYGDLNDQMIRLVKDRLSLLRRPKTKVLESLAGELPILLLILALQEAEKTDTYPGGEKAELFKSSLVHFFSTHYIPLYLNLKDPVKETLARVDWYLDGDDGTPEQQFARFASGLFNDKKGDLSEPLAQFAQEKILPEVKKALDLAPRYKH